LRDLANDLASLLGSLLLSGSLLARDLRFLTTLRCAGLPSLLGRSLGALRVHHSIVGCARVGVEVSLDLIRIKGNPKVTARTANRVVSVFSLYMDTIESGIAKRLMDCWIDVAIFVLLKIVELLAKDIERLSDVLLSNPGINHERVLDVGDKRDDL